VASDYFDLRKPGATYEIALLRNALYVIDASMFIDGGTAPVAGSAAEISISTTAHSVQIGGAANDAFRHQITGTTAQYHAQPSFRALLNADTSYGAAPVYTSIAVAQNTGSTATNVTVDFLVTLLGLGNTGF
jgi:hypothetical protein